jgi:hypothetical protein
MSALPAGWCAYDFAVLRVVPHPYAGEFVPVGVVLHVPTQERVAVKLRPVFEPSRLPGVDLELLQRYLHDWAGIARGDAAAGPLALAPASERFHWLTAPRSDVLQCSPVHAGVGPDPLRALDELFAAYVR